MLDLTTLFIERFGTSTPEQTVQYYFSPGRVNLIGEHIDYNGGQVLPIAISQGIRAAVRPTTNKLIRIQSINNNGELTVDIDTEGFAKRPNNWMNYPLGVIYKLWKSQQKLKKHLRIFETGFEMLIDSNLPMGSGLSSSAALEVVVAYVLFNQSYKKNLNQNDFMRVTLAILCQKAENDFVGVKCGIMDQFAVAMSKQNHALLLECDTLRYQYVPFRMRKYAMVILNTNKPRALADSKYNERKAECEQALNIIKKHSAIKQLCEATLNDLDFIDNPTLLRRARHVITENTRVTQTAKALIEGNWTQVGELLNLSHQSLRDDYEVTGFELDTLSSIARHTEGCVGSRMTGAGFGGCAIAIVKNELLEDFKITVATEYHKQTGLRLGIYDVSAQDGVKEL